jgi:chromatin segregation and condensation protein Rec8/ScpA/Scc1 (kleisin family)
MENLVEIIISNGEKDRKSLLAVNLLSIIKQETEDLKNKTNIEVAEKILELSILIKLKSELLLYIFSLEKIQKRVRELSDDEEITKILSIIEKGVSSKVYEHKGYKEVEEDDEIPVLKLSKIVKEILEREQYLEERQIKKNDFSIKEAIENVKKILNKKKRIIFQEIFLSSNSRVEVVITFLAILILAKNKFAKIVQKKTFKEIYIELNEERRLLSGN